MSSQFSIKGKRFFKIKKYFPLKKFLFLRFHWKIAHILVIAFTVKGACAFESKSDLLRQALRHKDQITWELETSLPIKKEWENKIGKDLIYLDPETKNLKSQDPYEKIQTAIALSRQWGKDHQDKKIVVISLIGVTDSENKKPLDDDFFVPVSVLVFFQPK